MNKLELKSFLGKTFPESTIEDTFDFPLLWVARDALFSVAYKLKYSEETNFNFLFCETAVDFPGHFEVVYHLSSTTFHHDMVLKVKLEKPDNTSIESVNSLWQAAEFYENEIYDMFGIKFLNHPNLRRFILGDEWPGYPLRKDYIDDVNLLTL